MEVHSGNAALYINSASFQSSCFLWKFTECSRDLRMTPNRMKALLRAFLGILAENNGQEWKKNKNGLWNYCREISLGCLNIWFQNQDSYCLFPFYSTDVVTFKLFDIHSSDKALLFHSYLWSIKKRNNLSSNITNRQTTKTKQFCIAFIHHRHFSKTHSGIEVDWTLIWSSKS